MTIKFPNFNFPILSQLYFFLVFKTHAEGGSGRKNCPHLLSSPTKSVGEEENNSLAHGFQWERDRVRGFVFMVLSGSPRLVYEIMGW